VPQRVPAQLLEFPKSNKFSECERVTSPGLDTVMSLWRVGMMCVEWVGLSCLLSLLKSQTVVSVLSDRGFGLEQRRQPIRELYLVSVEEPKITGCGNLLLSIDVTYVTSQLTNPIFHLFHDCYSGAKKKASLNKEMVEE